MRLLSSLLAVLTISTSAQAEEIRPLQELLSAAECNPGPIDGLWGGQTERALMLLLRDSELRIERPIKPQDIVLLQSAGLVCPPIRSTLDFVEGPFRGAFRSIASTDVRDLGCTECNPITRIIATPDFDGDGTSEIVLSMEAFDSDDRPTDVPIDILVLNADGQPYDGFRDRISRVHARQAIVADLNSDGVDDLFIAAHGKDGAPFPGENDVLILSAADGTHYDASGTHLPYLESMSHGASAGDIDGDGDLDIVIITNAGGGRSGLSNYFLINQGDGRFELSRGELHLPRQAQSDNAFLTAQLVDVDQNGAVDLLLAGAGDARQASLLIFGNGDGTFSSPITLPIPNWRTTIFTTDIDAKDIDGDGDLDIVLLHTGRFDGKNFKGIFIQILVNRGMKFYDETEFRMWPQNFDDSGKFNIAHNINLVDLNADGSLDFVVQSLNPLWKNAPGDVPPQIGLNRGNGFFDPVVQGWPRTNSWSGRQLVPISLEGNITFAGLSLNGLNDGGFRPIGHRLFVFRRLP